MKRFPSSTFLHLRSYSRSVSAQIIVANPFEFTILFGSLEQAQAAVEKFRNAAKGTIGYGQPTQVLFIPV